MDNDKVSLGLFIQSNDVFFSRFYRSDDNASAPVEYTVKGGSFADTRDGEFKKDKIQIRTSARKGFRSDYSAENLSFRCSQTVDADADSLAEYRVVRLRPPVHHHSNENHRHLFQQDEL